MGSRHPYYRRALPAGHSETASDGDGREVVLADVWPLPPGDPLETARRLLDTRAAAVIGAATGMGGAGDDGPPRIWPNIPWTTDGLVAPFFRARDLLELKDYKDKAPTIYIPTAHCLTVLAYLDYFPSKPDRGRGLRSMVSRALLSAAPGWCGSFGPGVDSASSLLGKPAEGNYDLTQVLLLPMAYRHYDDLSPAARDYLITQLLARGTIHRPRVDDTFTSGRNPNDWSRAGFVSPLGQKTVIGETENHVLMIVTTRYLTNQLLHQRDPLDDYDNRRNGGDDYPSCTSLLLSLLQNMLKGDFSEYNAKSYQSETRWALLNLCSYSYDHEVRLGARMVLDYLSAHMAVSSNDLRRLLPFRRRFEDKNAPIDDQGFMTVNLLGPAPGADPMSGNFAAQAGNLRAYGNHLIPEEFVIADPGGDFAIEILTDYRLPPMLHDLFVNDKHRRFFQRLHRTVRNDVGGNRNCDNMEIFAGSPSYLITAGGEPAPFAIDPGIVAKYNGDSQAQQLGVAVTTSFMPTTQPPAHADHPRLYRLAATNATDLIQFGEFSAKIVTKSRHGLEGGVGGVLAGGAVAGLPGAAVAGALGVWAGNHVESNSVSLTPVANYGVAPDFACGHQVWLPGWVNATVAQDQDGRPVDPRTHAGFSFIDMSRTDDAPGFFLALYQETPGGFAFLEAYDTWLRRDPPLTFGDFRGKVVAGNRELAGAGMPRTHLENNVPMRYIKSNGSQIQFVVWTVFDLDPRRPPPRGTVSGAEILSVTYGADPIDRVDSIGNAETKPPQLLNGTIMKSRGLEEAFVEITNPARGSTLTLDFTEAFSPRRHESETGVTEVAGPNSDVWVDFEYAGPSEGDVCRPFNSIALAADAVTDGGVIRIVPGATRDRPAVGGGKRFTVVAPIGGVTIGAREVRPPSLPESGGEVSNRDVWVQFDWPGWPEFLEIAYHPDLLYVYATLASAIERVAPGGVVHIEPGRTPERGDISMGKPCTLIAPIGGVTIGAGSDETDRLVTISVEMSTEWSSLVAHSPHLFIQSQSATVHRDNPHGRLDFGGGDTPRGQIGFDIDLNPDLSVTVAWTAQEVDDEVEDEVKGEATLGKDHELTWTGLRVNNPDPIDNDGTTITFTIKNGRAP